MKQITSWNVYLLQICDLAVPLEDIREYFPTAIIDIDYEIMGTDSEVFQADVLTVFLWSMNWTEERNNIVVWIIR